MSVTHKGAHSQKKISIQERQTAFSIPHKFSLPTAKEKFSFLHVLFQTQMFTEGDTMWMQTVMPTKNHFFPVTAT